MNPLLQDALYNGLGFNGAGQVLQPQVFVLTGLMIAAADDRQDQDRVPGRLFSKRDAKARQNGYACAKFPVTYI